MVKRLKKGRTHTHTKKTIPSWIMSFPSLKKGAQSLKQSSINHHSSAIYIQWFNDINIYIYYIISYIHLFWWLKHVKTLKPSFFVTISSSTNKGRSQTWHALVPASASTASAGQVGRHQTPKTHMTDPQSVEKHPQTIYMLIFIYIYKYTHRKNKQIHKRYCMHSWLYTHAHRNTCFC